MKKFFGFGSSTPPPPTPPTRPPAPPSRPGSLATNSGAKPTTVAPSIVGRWKEPKGSDTTEFHADGRVTEKPAGAADILGRYLFDGAKLEIRLEGVAEELVFSVALKGNSLEMTGPDGEKTRYERVS